jgi:DNA repair exonuclease SbcCD nuclease subunit
VWVNTGMKKRFLIVGDNHLDSKSPQSRIDNFLESSLMELQETLKIAKAVQADYYIMLGDVFDRIEVGGACRNRVLETLLSEEGSPWPFEKYVVVGNHDIAHNSLYLEKSALGTLINAGAVKCVDRIEELSVRFLHFDSTLDERLRNSELSSCQEKIFFCHASIVDKPCMFDHVLFSDLQLNKSAKLVVSGHIHAPMESEHQGVKFFNPGSLGRTKINERHSPQVLLVQYDYETDTFQNKYLKLKSALSHDVIFDIDKNNSRKNQNKNMELFLESVTHVSFEENISGDLENDLRVFASKRNVKKSIVDLAIEAINIKKSGGTL